MTRERAKELLPIIQAFAEGKTIQYRLVPDGFGRCEWECADDPEWVDWGQYRIKPAWEVQRIDVGPIKEDSRTSIQKIYPERISKA